MTQLPARAALIGLALLAAGTAWAGRGPDVRKAPDIAPVAPPPARPPAPVVPPPSWNSNAAEASTWHTAPDLRWGKTLPELALGPVTGDATHIVVATAGETLGLTLEGKSLWKQPIGASGAATLGLDGVWVGGADGQLRALDPATGAIKRTEGSAGRPAVRGSVTVYDKYAAWFDASGHLWTTAGWDDNACAAPLGGPAVDEPLAFVGCAEGVLIAVGRDGLKWTAALPGPAATSPTLDPGHAFIGYAAVGTAPGGVVALDRTGAVAWTFQSQFGPAADLSTLGNLLLLPDRDGRLYALDTVTGKKKWEVEGFGEWSVPPLFTADLIYAVNADGNLQAIDPDDGGVVWRVSLGSPALARPTRVGDLLVVPLASGRVVAWALPS